MYEVGVTGDFTAIHHMSGDVPPEETVPHQHNYQLEWNLWIKSLDERGYSIDISLLERIRDELAHGLKGKVLNDLDWFAGKTTSLESLCEHVYEKLHFGISKSLRELDLQRISRMEVRIWEHEHAWAGVEMDFTNKQE